jgi:hypothetical protein
MKQQGIDDTKRGRKLTRAEGCRSAAYDRCAHVKIDKPGGNRNVPDQAVPGKGAPHAAVAVVPAGTGHTLMPQISQARARRPEIHSVCALPLIAATGLVERLIERVRIQIDSKHIAAFGYLRMIEMLLQVVDQIFLPGLPKYHAMLGGCPRSHPVYCC